MIRTANIKKFIVSKKSTVQDILKVIDKNREGIALVVDDKSRLLGTITDGDVRRFILKNPDIHTKCEKIMNRSYEYTKKDSFEEIKRLMQENRIRHIPLIGKDRKLIRLFISDTIYEPQQGIVAVIMAGGEGRRLKEITPKTPKPLVEIGQKPILEEIITDLKAHNIRQIYIILNYKAKTIQRHFGDGSNFGVNVKYIIEKKKLGTAGALSLLPKEGLPETILVINSDLLTNANFKSLISFYHDRHFFMCIAAKEYVFDIPFGVFDMSNGYLIGIKEKPSQRFFCNAGIYVLNREIIKFVPKNKKFDMTDLIKIVTHRSLPVGAFPLFEYWIDIGNVDDYRRAKKEYNTVFKKRAYE